MTKYIILIIIFISGVFACHPSCNCDVGSKVCLSCKLQSIGSQMDTYQRSCPCPPGYYTSNFEPFTCDKFININSIGNDSSVILDSCKLEMSLKTKDIKVNTDCHFENTESQSIVVSNMVLNFNPISISDECKAAYVTKIQYFNQFQNVYLDLDQIYITNGTFGSKQITFPLIDIFNFASMQYVGDNQISQLVQLKVLIGSDSNILRKHSWNLFVFTNRDQVEVFTMDVDAQNTEGCQPGQECIVVADLDTVGYVYTDNTFTTKATAPFKYIVGDIFYAKIFFIDPSYTKYLKVHNLYYKNDKGKIFNFTSITTAKWQNNGLTIALPLVDPTIAATIQINMLIDPNPNRRFLAEAKLQNAQAKFSFIVLNEGYGNDSSKQQQSNNSKIQIFSIITLIMALLVL